MDTALRPWQRPHDRAYKRRPQFRLSGVLFAVFCASGFFAGHHYGAKPPVTLIRSEKGTGLPDVVIHHGARGWIDGGAH
jgi:hypothetical protein